VTKRPISRTLHRPDEKLLLTLLDAIPARVAVIGADLCYRYGNRSFLEFFGLSAEEVIGKSTAEVWGPDLDAKLRPIADRALAGETVRWEGWITYRLGNERYVQQIVAPYRVGDGTPEGMFALTRDITDLKRAQETLAKRADELQASAALNAALTASALDCIVAMDESGCVVEFNPAAERTFGYRREEALGRPIADLIVPPALRDRHKAGLAHYLQTGSGTVLGRRIEIEAMRADGTLFPIELAIAEVKQPGLRLFTASIRDLTEARNAAAEIERQREAIQQQEKLAAFGSLLAGIAHELNNPLSMVIGHSQMLAETAAAPEIGARAAKILSAAERCARIVRTFLAMARQRKTERRSVNIRETIDAAIELVAYGLRSSGIEVTCFIPPGLPAAFADSDQLHQIVINLLINAQQALEDSPPPRRITVVADVADTSARELLVTFADNGPGVPAEIASRIFDPFFTTKPMGVGTGIGLAVCRGIIEAHGGSLQLATNSGPGARFELRIPVAAGAAAPADSPEPKRRVAAHPVATALIVDDEKGLADLLSEILTVDGFRCDIANSGRDAQAQIGAHDYDVIVCDLRMPDLDGPALFRWLRKERPELTSKIVFLTGDTLGPAASRFLSDSGRPVVEKPFVPEEIRRVIASVAAGGNN
jgi:PAS domain S-box-containing protein